MREIKFRAWDKALKFMHSGNQFISMYLDKDGCLNSPELEFLQYTGLKDKNGKEIFEGDIINDCSRGWTVKTSDNGAWLLDYANGSGEKYLYPINKHIEVIGNIYENPELLK
jgi:uncharacterized phage protein (TIGR01671 family)